MLNFMQYNAQFHGRKCSMTPTYLYRIECFSPYKQNAQLYITKCSISYNRMLNYIEKKNINLNKRELPFFELVNL